MVDLRAGQGLGALPRPRWLVPETALGGRLEYGIGRCRAAGTVVAMVSDHRSRMPTAALGAGGPVVSRIGLGLAALGRPAYITSGREQDLPDRSVAGMRTRTFSMLDAAYAAGVRYVDAARSYGRAEEFLAGWLAERGHGLPLRFQCVTDPLLVAAVQEHGNAERAELGTV